MPQASGDGRGEGLISGRRFQWYGDFGSGPACRIQTGIHMVYQGRGPARLGSACRAEPKGFSGSAGSAFPHFVTKQKGGRVDPSSPPALIWRGTPEGASPTEDCRLKSGHYVKYSAGFALNRRDLHGASAATVHQSWGPRASCRSTKGTPYSRSKIEAQSSPPGLRAGRVAGGAHSGGNLHVGGEYCGKTSGPAG